MEMDTKFQTNKEGRENADSTGVIFFLIAVFVFVIWMMTRRISRTESLPGDCAGIKLYGVVTGISDGDGFRFFHCPWPRSRSYTSEDGRLYIRLAGIDAPEMGSSNMPGQPFAEQSKKFLGRLIQGENIKIRVVGKDQYDRVLAFAYLPRLFLKPLFNGWIPIGFFELFHLDILYTNVNSEMVRNGYACVYKGRDAIYEEYKETLISLQKKAKREKKGMWKLSNPESPMIYKRSHRE